MCVGGRATLHNQEGTEEGIRRLEQEVQQTPNISASLLPIAQRCTLVLF